jgi:hypothetical protein
MIARRYAALKSPLRTLPVLNENGEGVYGETCRRGRHILSNEKAEKTTVTSSTITHLLSLRGA